METFLFAFFLYAMVTMWNQECSWYFNQYSFSGYTLITVVRKYQAKILD